MNSRRRTLRAMIALMACAALLVGCGMSAEEQAVVQEKQLEEYISQANAWGGEIIAQIPEPETEMLSTNAGGVGLANDDYEEWPKFYYWDRIAVLKAEGARTPTQMADDLEPWLEEQGWVRNTDRDRPPGKESFERHYYQDGYHLVVEVYTVPPPHAQKVKLMIVSPQTDPDRD